MFKKLEAWLANIVAVEVDKVETHLEAEKERIASYISIHTKACLNGLEAETRNLLAEFESKLESEASRIVADKNKLIAELKVKLAELTEKVQQLEPSHWKAEDHVVAADDELRKVK